MIQRVDEMEETIMLSALKPTVEPAATVATEVWLAVLLS
jgi:hypothetical protein